MLHAVGDWAEMDNAVGNVNSPNDLVVVVV